jgi:hypothetical protein
MRMNSDGNVAVFQLDFSHFRALAGVNITAKDLPIGRADHAWVELSEYRTLAWVLPVAGI